MSGVELLAPAGDFETALAAFAAGADAVYCGLSAFSARAFAKNLSFAELADLLACARDGTFGRRRRVYVAFNTVVDEPRMGAALETAARLAELGPDAAIVQDLGLARACRRHFPELELHASTQLVAHNLEGVLALKELGFRRAVLARELSLEETRMVAQRCGAMKETPDGRGEMEVECFVHGALCYSVSGLCLFGAMEQDRSGNRGACPYCCRQCHGGAYPFSMKDLQLGERARALADAGVTSLKIEGRMKSALYVASATRYYRQVLDGAEASPDAVTEEDLKTVFSRRTTSLYFDGRGASSPVDCGSPGHLGAKIGEVKKVTKDREGRSWLRVHPVRALERHDGLQFDALNREGRHLGFGIGEMRLAISRRNVFEAPAGSDLEILLPDDAAPLVEPGQNVYCAMSNAVKRRFPVPSFRAADHESGIAVDVAATLRADGIEVRATSPVECAVSAEFAAAKAKDPSATAAAARKALSRLGGTAYRPGRFDFEDPEGLFVPMGVLNSLRRELVARLDEAVAAWRERRVAAALADVTAPSAAVAPLRVAKVRFGQAVPEGEWDEVVVAAAAEDFSVMQFAEVAKGVPAGALPRVALPVWTSELDFGRLRAFVRRLLREGCARWECSDLATLRLLREAGAADVTADWTLFAFNRSALSLLSELGVRRAVASPENSRENLRALAASGFAVEFLFRQSTPLFISLTKPATEGVDGLKVFRRGGLWVTTREKPRQFAPPDGAPTRVDVSWDPPAAADLGALRGSLRGSSSTDA